MASYYPRLRDLREDADMTQDELVKLLDRGLDPNFHDLETGGGWPGGRSSSASGEARVQGTVTLHLSRRPGFYLGSEVDPHSCNFCSEGPCFSPCCLSLQLNARTQ